MPHSPQPALVHSRRPLRNISEVRHFFRTNEVPDLLRRRDTFQSAGTRPLGAELLLRQPTTTAGTALIRECSRPKHKPYIEFEQRRGDQQLAARSIPRCGLIMSRPAPPGQRPKVAMVFFDAETERICDELGYDLILPSAELREHLDSKLVTTRLGNEVGAPSVPNVLITVEEYRRAT